MAKKNNVTMLTAGASYLYVAAATGRVLGPMRIAPGANGQEEVSVTMPDGVIAVENPAGGNQLAGRRIQDVDGISDKDLKKVQDAMDAHLETLGKSRAKAQAQKDADASAEADKLAAPKPMAVATEEAGKSS